jgi:hypothetical protein
MTSRLTPGATLVVLALIAAQARADIRFAEPLADAGNVHAGVPLHHPFAFVNEGPQPVDIMSLRASCGCLRPHVDKRTWQAGEKGAVNLDVNTLGLPSGPHTWRLYVTCQAGETTYEVPLQLTGHVITEVSVQPASLTVFAESAVGHEILVTDLRAHPLSISSLQTSSPKLKSRVAGTYTDEMGRQVRRIQIDVAEDYPEGRHEEAVDIYTDDPGYRDLRVPVTIVKRSPQKLTLMPAQVEVTAAKGQEVPSKIILIRSGGDEPVVVDRVETESPAVVCQWARGPGPMTTVRVTIDRSKLGAPQLRTTVRIHVREPSDETLSLPVNCTLE